MRSEKAYPEPSDRAEPAAWRGQRVAGALRGAIGIATRGRAEILLETLREIDRQTRTPDGIIVAHVTEADIPNGHDLPRVRFLRSPPGLPRQRNAILQAAADYDVLLFLDDDFLPAPRYLEATLAVFRACPDVVMTTGNVLTDGARGPGIDPAAGREILARHGDDAIEHAPVPTFSGYGCNMAVRLGAVRARGLRFDERLPLYAWYEDIDFSRRLGAHGKIVRVAGARGVHLGIKSGRTSGRRLGYSQVVNPLYLWRKGTYPLSHALRSAGRHLLINCGRSLRPEPWVDRRGRLLGNSIAMLDILRGRAKPERILDL
ncbi:MAG TPA: glycosyltransferase [Acetobacteraceae bacterium]|nr:glycosyltransferase [Acetobacteraceae bacterium]